MNIKKAIYRFILIAVFSCFTNSLIGQNTKITCGENFSEAQLNLEKGFYEIIINVWVSAGSSIKGIQTTLGDNKVVLDWEFNEIVDFDQWVVMSKEFSLNESISNGLFKMEVLNDEKFGIGEGSFYLDDISLYVKDGYKDYDNFTIEAVGETCVDKNNGQIKITAKETYNYTVFVDTEKYTLIDELTISNLDPGTYNVCIVLDEVGFEQCFNVNIEPGVSLKAKAEVTSKKVSINIEKGTAPYTIKVNGIPKLTTSSSLITLDVLEGDLVEVNSKVICEGIFTKQIESVTNVSVYPNPPADFINIKSSKGDQVLVFNTVGVLIDQFVNNTGVLTIATSNFSSGVYIIKVISNGKVFIEKIVVN